MALLFMSERSGVGRQMNLDALCGMLGRFFLLEMVNMVKKQGQRYNRMG